ncbi:MAG: isocitrate dehydrogenase [Deltaproteobacteria bacterium]|nr:isocitrate dehydrogenase [Deltaproteobacteria bacterium]MBW2412894.1 isocitrate dehydrogenase [Deltaproteobacteria bacterium]
MAGAVVEAGVVTRVTELRGDGIGAELRAAVHAAAAALPVELDFEPIDLSLESRRQRGASLYDEAEESLRRNRVALKYPTATEDESPNAELRRRLGFSVIHRPVMSIEGVQSNFKGEVFLHIIRVATGGTYDDPGRMIGSDAAVSLRIVERRPCHEAARYAFGWAQDHGLTVTSSSKHTIQRTTDGFFESIVRDVSRDFPGVTHNVELFDALLAKIILKPRDFQVVLCLNEYGDFLSDMACGLTGSLGTGASGTYSFDAQGATAVAMFDPAGGTAPDIAGQDRCNPSAALLALAMLLDHTGHPGPGGALRQALLDSIAAGKSTPDIGGDLSTSAFTAAVLARLPDHLDR